MRRFIYAILDVTRFSRMGYVEGHNLVVGVRAMSSCVVRDEAIGKNVRPCYGWVTASLLCWFYSGAL